MLQAHTVSIPDVHGTSIPPLPNKRNGNHKSPALGDKAEIFDLIPGLVIVMDREHTVLDLNETAARTAGRTKQSCVGAKFWDLFDNPDCRAGTCAAAQAVKTGVCCEGVARPMIQGKEVPVLVTAAPRFAPDGQVIGVVELVFPAVADITLSDEIDRLAKAAKAGQLSERIEENKFPGRHLSRARCVNELLDAVTVPLIEATKVLKRMAVNDHTIGVEGAYAGIFAELSGATNQVQTRVKHVVEICESIAAGDFKKDLEELKKIGKRSENDTLIPALVQMMNAIGALVGDTDMLSTAAVSGKLSTRADASRHQGE